MSNLIDKDALVAEIKKRIKETESMQPKFDQFWAGQISAFKGVLKILDTLEVKELQKEPVSKELEKVVEEIVEPTILNAYGTKELARRLRNTICGTPVSEDLEEATNNYVLNARKGYPRVMDKTDKYICNAFKAGAKWQFNQLEKNRLKHCNSITNEQAELEQGFIDQHLDKHQRMPTFLDAIEYGMILQKQKMMVKAIDAHVNYAWSGLDFGGFDWSKTGLDLGDKCKLIIIKED